MTNRIDCSVIYRILVLVLYICFLMLHSDQKLEIIKKWTLLSFDLHLSPTLTSYYYRSFAFQKRNLLGFLGYMMSALTADVSASISDSLSPRSMMGFPVSPGASYSTLVSCPSTSSPSMHEVPARKELREFWKMQMMTSLSSFPLTDLDGSESDITWRSIMTHPLNKNRLR